jgi:hypothetical protein
VVDVIQRDETVYYVFESGHELPLLCFCCGEPLEYEDLEASRRDIIGRRLESMAVEPVELDGHEMLQFRLELSRKGPLSQPLAMPVSVQVAAQMVHPPTCRRGARASASGHPPGTRRRKKRRR